MIAKKIKNKTKKAALGAGMAVLLPTLCIIGGAVIGTALGVGVIIMTVQDIIHED